MSLFYPTSAIRLTIGRKRTHLGNKHKQDFLADFDSKSIENKQIALFNHVWKKAIDLPFYKEWKRINNLPVQISHLQEIDEWPVLTKNDLRERSHLVEMTPGIVGSYRTSGSTSEPFNFPKGVGELPEMYSTMWAYRSAQGLLPFDPFLAVANTSAGAAQSRMMQAKTRLIRALKDIAGNSWKTDGFIPTSDVADKALRSMKFLRTKYIIGYPSGIAAIARRAEQLELKIPSLTHAILTSETIDAADIELIERALEVKVLIEYGAVELGAIAGSWPDAGSWPLKVHWWSFLVQLEGDQSARITSLENRLFPLINYSIGDVLQPGETTPAGSILSIEHIEGRTRDIVTVGMRDGSSKSVSARGLTYLVRDLPEVTSIQVAQRDSNEVELYVVAHGADRDALIKKISSSFRRNRREFLPGSIGVTFIDHHIPSARGKRGVLVNRSDAPLGNESYSIIDN